MAIRYGGSESPKEYGFPMTIESPAGTTSSNPVNVGDLFKLGGTDADGSGYKAVANVSGNDATSSVIVQATERKVDVGPMGVWVIARYSQIRRLPYKSGSAPSIGQSVEASSDLKTVVGKSFDGDGYVLYVDTVNLEVEVLC